MSRTEKDRPYWVKVRDPRTPTVEEHHHVPSFWQRIRGTAVLGCDLADFDAATDRTARGGFFCVRHLAVEYHRRYHRGGPAPAWFTHHVWFEPERTRERDALREAAKAYRAAVAAGCAADWDFDFANHQHRQCGRWLWD